MPRDARSEWRVNSATRSPGRFVADVWRARELIGFFALRDLRLRYQQTFLGVSWVVLQSAITVALFTLVFNRLADVDPGSDIPYPVFALAGFASWTYFSGVQSQGSESLAGSANLVTKVAFPRITAPLGSQIPPLLDLGIALVLLVILSTIYGVAPTWRLTLLPLYVFALLVTSLGANLWLSALNVLYRDVRYALAPLLQIGLFLSPVAYPVTALEGAARVLYFLNPMAGVIEVGRWCLIGASWPGPAVAASAATSLLLALSGIWYFRRTERIFADVI